MLYVYEFEVFKSEGWLIAFPFDFDGGTQGADEKEVAKMAADWLKTELEYCLMEKLDVPEPTFGNTPKCGGRVLLVAVEVSLETIDAVPAHKAADLLGVSRGRITQMVSAGLLMGFRRGRDAFVTADSIKARQADARKTLQAERTERTEHIPSEALSA